MPMQQTKMRLSTVKEMPKLYPVFTQDSIRWLIYNEKTNDFSKVLRRIGGKILIDLDDFESWITEHRGDKAS